MAVRTADTPPVSRNGDGSSGPHRLLVVANEAIGDDDLVQQILAHAHRPTQVRIVSPALVKSPLDLATGDVDDAREQARGRLDRSIEALRRAGIDATGDVGEAEPVLAVQDALRLFPADEVAIVARPRERAVWSEHDLLEQLRREITTPITYIEVDPGGHAVRDVKEVESQRNAEEARADQAAFEAYYIPPMPTRDLAAIIVGPLGCIALALLAIDCKGDVTFDFTALDWGCIVSWVLGVFAFIITAIHVPAILLLRAGRHTSEALTSFLSWFNLITIPLFVLIAAGAVIVS